MCQQSMWGAAEEKEREARAADTVIVKATEKQDAKTAAKVAHKEARIVAMTEVGKGRHLEVAS